MRRLAGAVSAVLCTALALAAPPARAARTHGFTSPAGFSLTYAEPWRPRGTGGDELLLLSAGRSVQGPVIGSGQGAILVRALGPAPSAEAFDSLLAARGAADAAGGRRPARAIPATGDCRDLVEVDTRDASGPGGAVLDVSFYCRARGLVVVVQVTRHAGDPRGAAYRRAALTLAGTLRLTPPARTDTPRE